MTHLTELRRSAKRRSAVGALLLTTGLATLSLANSPLASGQQVGVGNNGGATAGTGGNGAVGNNSGNAQTSDTTATSGGLLGLGGLVDLNIGLGAPSNTSSGTGTVNSGPATASGSQSDTGVDQVSAGGGSGSGFNPANPFAPPAPPQSVTITNGGQANASTGGNTATGNNSVNEIGATGSASLVGVGLGLAPPTNTSTGNATVNSGAATANGNRSTNDVTQAKIGDANGGGLGAGGFGAPGFGPGFVPGTVTGFGSAFDPCSSRFFPFSPFFGGPTGPNATITNSGSAGASTGNNEAIGNNSVNTITNSQTISGGLIGVGLNLGAPTNDSTGTATIGTGAANATGNQSTNSINQVNAPCGLGAGTAGPGLSPRNVITGAPIVVPVITPATVKSGTLARTGFGTAALLLLAASMMFGGSMLLGSSRRRQMATAAAATPKGISSDEWEAAARWHRGGPRLL